MKPTLLLTIFLIPLLGATGNFGFEQTKILFFILSIILIGLIWLGKGIRWSKIQDTGAVFIVILLLTSLTGVDLKASLLGSEPYFQGWVVYAFLWLFALMVASAKIELEHWAIVLAGSAVVVGLVAIQDWISLNIFGQQIPTYAGRVVSTFGQPNFFAGFLLLNLPFCYLLFKNSARISQGHSLSTQGVTLNKLSYFGMISGLISIIGIFVSYSRSTILLALLLLLLVLFSSLSSRRRAPTESREGSINNTINWIPAFAGMTVLVLIITVFLSIHFSSGIVGNEISRPFLTKNPDLTRESVEKRAYIWPVAFKIALQKPLTGYGLENIGGAFANYFTENKRTLFEANPNVSPVLISLKDLNIDRSHNYILDLLIFSGGIGLLGWLGLVGVLFKKLRQKYNGRYRNVLIVSLITYLVWVQFQNQSIVHLIYFWLLVGLIDRT